MDQGNYDKNTSEDGLGQSLSRSLFKAPEERPYRRRIKPPPAKVHHVHPARFRRFVQRRTCCSLQRQPNDDDAAAATTTTSTSSATTTEKELQRRRPPPPPADVATTTAGAGRLEATRRSMQDAYMAWCSSNDIPLSPGTMAELTQCIRPNDQGASC